MVKCDVGGEIKGSNDDGSKSPANSFSVIGKLSFVDRFLSLWIISVMVIGVVVGFYSPETQGGLASIEGLIFKVAMLSFTQNAMLIELYITQLLVSASQLHSDSGS
jgi:ACR3 family arsenite efflux pump ArsB